MCSYLILKLLDTQSIFLPSTLIYGAVELRSDKADSDYEIAVLKESASSNRLDFDKYAVCARIATIVDCDNLTDAIDIADNKFSEVLDLKSVEFPNSYLKTSNIGYIKNLDSGHIQPLVRQEFGTSMSFVVHRSNIQCFDLSNYILSKNTELSCRYLRSLHWARNAKHEKNKQLKIIFYWFAIEALLKESENDNISGVLRWCLGFPNGKKRNEVSTSILNSLNAHPRYEYWSKEIITIVDQIRIFRNDSVHSGFRSVDFTKSELELYTQVMTFGASRCQSAVNIALINRIETVSDFKEYIGVIFESKVGVINDVHGNLIYSLDKIKQVASSLDGA
jgi:hypothetical protein